MKKIFLALGVAVILFVHILTGCSRSTAQSSPPEIGGKFVFDSIRDPKNSYGVHLLKDEKITFLGNKMGIPIWSPDGKTISCMSKEGLVLLAEDGTRKGVIKTLFTYPHQTSWTPDGKNIFYTTSTGEYSTSMNAICVINLETKEQKLVYDTKGEYSILSVRVSPDGKRILFAHDIDAHTGGTFVMDIDGSNVKLLRKNAGVADWFPDSKHIGFDTNMDESGNLMTNPFTTGQIGYYFKMNIETGEVKKVREMRIYPWNMKLSRDGKYLYYAKSSGETARSIFVSPLENPDIEIQVTEPVPGVTSQDAWPDWYQGEEGGK